MKKFSIRAVKQEINKKPTINEKLNYWKGVIHSYIYEPILKQPDAVCLYYLTPEEYTDRWKRLKKFFGKKCTLHTELFIPESIYNEHFSNGLNEPEFTYWFLQYRAFYLYEYLKHTEQLPEKLKTPLAENFIRAELKKINDFEQKAENLLHEGKIDIYSDFTPMGFTAEFEYLRVKAGYYKTHVYNSDTSMAALLYAKHIHLKHFLESQLSEILPPQPGTFEEKPEQETQTPQSQEEIRIRNEVLEGFENFDNMRWQYAFLSENDYVLFTDLLINYLSNKPYTLPETVIQLKKNCKTKVAKVLGEIHRGLSNNKLNNDVEYFKIIKTLNHFEKITQNDLYKALTR